MNFSTYTLNYIEDKTAWFLNESDTPLYIQQYFSDQDGNKFLIDDTVKTLLYVDYPDENEVEIIVKKDNKILNVYLQRNLKTLTIEDVFISLIH